jgi:hypothetical protein
LFWDGNWNVVLPLLELWAARHPDRTVMANAKQMLHHINADEMKSFEGSRVVAQSITAMINHIPDSHRYAEAIAFARAEVQIQLPDQRRTFIEMHRIAAATHQCVCQLEAQGIFGAALLEHMATYIPNLHRLWNTATDDLLVALCQIYPGLYRCGYFLKQPWPGRKGRMPEPPTLPDSVMPTVLRLLSDGTMLERELLAICDAPPQRDFRVQAELLLEMYRHWSALLMQLPSLAQEAGTPEVVRAVMRGILEPMAQRVEYIRAQVYETRPFMPC